MEALTLAALAFLALGALALLLGLRGRRIDREPRCPARRCKYALGSVISARSAQNEDPFPLTCPECGRVIAQERALRIGTRKKRPLVAILGALLLLGGASTLGYQLWQTPAATRAKYMPLSVLLYLAERDTGMNSWVHQRELLDRASEDRISASAAPRVIDRLIAWQDDPRREPTFAGRTLDQFADGGLMTIEQQNRAWANLWRFTVTAPPSVAPGESIPLTFTARYKPGALGSLPIADASSPWFRKPGDMSMFQQTNFRVERITVNGKEIDPTDHERLLEPPPPSRWTGIFDFSIDWFPDTGPPKSFIAPDGPPGAVVTIDLDIHWDIAEAGGPGLAPDPEQGGKYVTIDQWLERRGTPIRGSQTIRVTTTLRARMNRPADHP